MAGGEWVLPEGVTLEAISPSNMDALRALNRVLFPINYSEKTYADILACGPVTQLAMAEGRAVGAIACRLEPAPECIQLYIVTLGVLAPWRRLGLASALLGSVLALTRAELPEVRRAALHVHTVNEEALEFYGRHAFHRGEVLRGYYRRLDPPDAYLLTLPMETGDDSSDTQP